ncbi:MAG: hypothetical protein QOK00_1127 [Thermoleophilaceae bacterium]|jgi:hypothetical protein|nr:hypothetical protein [Thermoleophilaceae bacterium]MEA2400724.1 hypothetical protein [Thermoleophilaceae bacterium]MEA2456501.1 hypothetical protein [Thermoleophilaceae bacterium]
MSTTAAFDEELERRLDSVSRPENQGDPLTSSDYLQLVVVTLAVPVVLMIGAWFA